MPSVAEFPYMEGFIFICKWKLHVAVERTNFFLTVTREHVLKMNVVLIKECTHLLKLKMHLA